MTIFSNCVKALIKQVDEGEKFCGTVFFRYLCDVCLCVNAQGSMLSIFRLRLSSQQAAEIPVRGSLLIGLPLRCNEPPAIVSSFTLQSFINVYPPLAFYTSYHCTTKQLNSIQFRNTLLIPK